MFSAPSTTPVWSALYSSPQAIGTPVPPSASIIETATGEAMVRIFMPSRSSTVRTGSWVKKLRAPESM